MNSKAVLMRLAQRITNTPLMIQPEKLDVILGVVGNRIGLDVPPVTEAAVSQTRTPANTRTNIAVIPIYGSLVHRTMGLDALSGLMSYEAIRRSFRAAMAEPDIDAILLDVDSPGGEVAGVFDLADEIFEARSKKRIYGIANESAYSAAYLLLSQAETVFTPRTGAAGSIGVIAVHMNQSGFDAKVGVQYTAIYAGKQKNDYSPHQALKPEVHARLQKSINGVYGLFTDTVARGRGSTPDIFQATEAGIYDGDAAVKAGLADRVMSMNQALQFINADIRQGGRTMTDAKGMTQEQLGAQLQGLMATPNVDIAAALAELGFVPKAEEAPADIEALTADAEARGRKDAQTTMTGILDLCLLGGVPEMANVLLKEGATVEEARKKILDYKASKDGKNEIISTVTPTNTGEVNPLLADARKRRDGASK
jgi:signal peptide peptidase SppA